LWRQLSQLSLQNHQQENRDHSGGADEFGGDVDERFDNLVGQAREHRQGHHQGDFPRSLINGR